MVTFESIQELQRRTSVSSLEAVHALSQSQDDLELALSYRRSTRLVTKSLRVADVDLSIRLSARLVVAGLWFECEKVNGQWQFGVAPAGHASLVGLHSELLASQDTDRRLQPAGPTDDPASPDSVLA